MALVEDPENHTPPPPHRVFQLQSPHSNPGDQPVAPVSLETKKAYYAKTRRSNYEASLRLEGFDTTPEDAERPLPTRKAVLDSYRKK